MKKNILSIQWQRISFITIATDVEILNIDYTVWPNSSDLITLTKWQCGKLNWTGAAVVTENDPHSTSEEYLWNVFIMIKSIIHIIFAFFRPVLERDLQVHPDPDILPFDPLWNHLQSQPTLHTSRVYSIQSHPSRLHQHPPKQDRYHPTDPLHPVP